MTNNYGYRAVPVSVPGVAGVIQRGSRARMQRKGQRFVLNRPVTIVQNRVDGVERSVTVLAKDGRAIARLEPGAIY